MPLRSILRYPDPRLHKRASKVEGVTDDIRHLIKDMAATMYAAPGIGLAATQVNVHQRVIVIDVSESHDQLQVFINPEIVWSSAEKAIYEEGCLSIPEFYSEVERPAQVKVKYLDLDGALHEVEADGLLATCLQHEIDHLNGILFIDRISKLKRDRVIKKFAKAAKRAAEEAQL